MAAYLQWRRFVFFDREMVKEPPGPEGAGGKPFALPPGITVCDSGRGSLVFGDILYGGGKRDEAGPSGLPRVRGLGPAGRAAPRGETCAVWCGLSSETGPAILQPWVCGSFLGFYAPCALQNCCHLFWFS